MNDKFKDFNKEQDNVVMTACPTFLKLSSFDSAAAF